MQKKQAMQKQIRFFNFFRRRSKRFFVRLLFCAILFGCIYLAGQLNDTIHGTVQAVCGQSIDFRAPVKSTMDYFREIGVPYS